MLKNLILLILLFGSFSLFSQTNGNYNWIFAQDGASTNNYLKWNGTGWVPSAIAYSDFSSALKDSLATVVISSVSEFANYPNTLRQKVLIWNDSKRGGVFVLSQTGSPNGATIFQGTPSVNKWVRVVEDERIDVKWFGAVGDGTTNDDVPLQAWANFVANNNAHGYLSKGTYLTSSTTTIDSMSQVTISGDGPDLSIIKRKANTALSTTNPSGALSRLLRVDGSGGDKVTIYNIGFDGNSGNQGSPDSSTAWQQYHSLYLIPSGSLGFQYINIHDVNSYNPLGDGIGINSSSSDGVGEVNISNIYEYNRSYTRSTVTLTTNFNKVNAQNIIGPSFQIEPNGFSGPSTTYRYNLNLSNCSLLELDANLLGARSAGRKGDANISNVTVRGRTIIQEFDANVNGCKFYLSEPFRMAYGSYRIEQCLFYADSAFNTSTGDFMVYQAAANPTDYAYFTDCDFKRHSSVTLSYVYSDDNGYGTNTREISFTKCRFGDNTNIIRTAGVRSGKFIFDGCNHSYATSNSPCINYRGSAAKSSITNEMHVYRNTIDNNTSFLVGHPLASNLLKYYSYDNKVWDGQLIYWSRYDSIGGLKGPVTNLRIETPAVYYQSKGSSLSATNKPNTGRWVKGDIFYYAVPINGYMGVVCDTSGNGDGTSATGATSGAKFSYFGPVNEGVSSALAGDVSGEYNANVIGSNKVTNAKLATAPAWTFKIRNANSTGNVSDAALADITTYATPAAGDYFLAFKSTGDIVKVDYSSLPSGGGGGITTLNTLTASTQTFATGTSGSDFNISSATSTHTFNLPTASATNRGALSSADWTTFNNKQPAGNYFVTGGNSFAATAIVGTNDNNSMEIETNNVTRVSVSSGTSTGGDITLTGVTANTSTVQDRVVIQTNSSGTPSNSFGGALIFKGESSTTDNRDMVRLSAIWTNATDASRSSALVYSDVSSAGSITERFRFTPSAMTLATGYTIGNSAQSVTIGGSTGTVALVSNSSNGDGSIQLNSTGTSAPTVGVNNNGVVFTNTVGTKKEMVFPSIYSASSGSGSLIALSIETTYDVNTSATGVQKSIDINTSISNMVSSYRAIDIQPNHANAIGIYQSGTSTTNRFAGKTTIGSTTAPTSLLMFAAGTTSANSAPLKFTSGSLMTTAEAGAVEFNGSYYATKTSGLRFALGGTIADFTSDANNTGTGETDLYSYTTPASTLAATGEKLHATYSGTFNDATATEQLKVLFGGTTIFDSGALTTTGTGSWSINVVIIRTGASTARASTTMVTDVTTAKTYVSEIDLTGLTFTNTNILKITGTAGGGGGGNNDITGKLGVIFWYGPANN